MTVAALDLELDVFAGPFDLLIAVVLREEVDLLEVELGEVVVAYLEYLERQGELELEVGDRVPGPDRLAAGAEVAADPAGRRRRHRGDGPRGGDRGADRPAARVPPLQRRRRPPLVERFEAQRGYLYRAAPLPPELRRVALEAASAVYDPEQLGAALGDLLTPPPEVDIGHIRPTVSLEKRLEALREALSRGAPASTSTSSSATRTASPRP